MDPYAAVAKLCLAGAAVFALLWLVTPADSRYETVDNGTVSTRAAFRNIALVLFGAWLAIQLRG